MFVVLMGAPTTASAKGGGGGHGANTSGPYDRDESNVGKGTNQGHSPNGNGTRGHGVADRKNPPGQVGNTHSHGYECNSNKGIGDKGGNPAHTGCTVVSPPGGGGTPPGGGGTPPGGGGTPPGGGGTPPGGGVTPPGGGSSTTPSGGARSATQPVPTVVNAGLATSTPGDGAIIGAGALASLVAGTALLLARRRLRSES